MLPFGVCADELDALHLFKAEETLPENKAEETLFQKKKRQKKLCMGKCHGFFNRIFKVH